jgi:vanillate O-demethylase monooxygenase subunit
MYPYSSGDTLVRNRWYIAAFGEEVSQKPIERTFFGLPVVLYRTSKGDPVAMYGLCPHRYYPLALGHVEDGAIVCGYHGFAFGSDGRCVRIPSQATGADFCQPTYAVQERGPLIWIWMGDQARCDPSLLPPYEDFGLDQPGWTECAHCRFDLKARPQLLVDNLMDLTHLPFIHQQLGADDGFLLRKPEAEQRERSYSVRRPGRVPWSPYYEFLFGAAAKFDGVSTTESVTDFYGPELIRTSGPITTAIDGLDAVPPAIGKLYYLHGITPASETTTHYFGFITRNFRLRDQVFDEALRRSTVGVRQQDVDALEAVEARVDAAAARQRELLSRADAPAVRVRKLIQEMLDQEAAWKPRLQREA